mgnify:CR=1 FL=1
MMKPEWNAMFASHHYKRKIIIFHNFVFLFLCYCMERISTVVSVDSTINLSVHTIDQQEARTRQYTFFPFHSMVDCPYYLDWLFSFNLWCCLPDFQWNELLMFLEATFFLKFWWRRIILCVLLQNFRCCRFNGRPLWMLWIEHSWNNVLIFVIKSWWIGSKIWHGPFEMKMWQQAKYPFMTYCCTSNGRRSSSRPLWVVGMV